MRTKYLLILGSLILSSAPSHADLLNVCNNAYGSGRAFQECAQGWGNGYWPQSILGAISPEEACEKHAQESEAFYTTACDELETKGYASYAAVCRQMASEKAPTSVCKFGVVLGTLQRMLESQ